MDEQKKNFTRNQEILITIGISLTLTMLCYILSYLVNNHNTGDKVTLFLLCVNDWSTLWLLVDVIPPNLIVWSIIGIISNLGEAEESKHKEKAHKLVVSSFFVYILWYILYWCFRDVLGFCIANSVFIVVLFIILLNYFKETKDKNT